MTTKAMKDYLRRPELKDGWLYRIRARNADLGIWFAKNDSFVISRLKFGNNFLFEEYHWDCESFATVKPLRELEKSPFDPSADFAIIGITYPKEAEGLEYLNDAKGRFSMVKDLVYRIEDYGFECEAGHFKDCQSWQRLRTKMSCSAFWFEEVE